MLEGVSDVNLRPRRTPRSEVRQRILAAALKTFAAHGFAGATIDLIADAAGFTKGAVYSNFGSKDDLFFALLDDQFTRRIALVTAILEQTKAAGDTKSRAAAVGRRLMQEMRDNTDYQILFVEYWLRATRDPEVRKRFVEHRTAMLAEAAKALDPEFAAQLSLSPQTLVTLAVALTNGFAIEEIIAPGTAQRHLLGDVLELLDNRDTTTRDSGVEMYSKDDSVKPSGDE
jgi:AcrR family transcriptional regulator